MTSDERKEYVDLDAALARVRGNKTIYLKMLGMFAASGEFAALEKSLAANDCERGAQIAHGIKGMTANLGMDRLAQAAADLMLEMRTGTVSAALAKEYRQTLLKTQQVLGEIQQELQQVT